MQKQSKNTRNTRTAAAAPAQAAPAQAATKYTRSLATHGAAIGGLQPGAVATFGAVTVNGRAVFAKFNGTFTATRNVKLNPNSYAAAVYNAINGQAMPQAAALAMVAAAKQPGAVPAKYSASYAAVAAWLQGKGPQPGATHIVNCAQHLRGYLQGYMLKAAHGAMVLK